MTSNKRTRRAVADTRSGNRKAWDQYTAGMAEDWKAFTRHEHKTLIVLADREADSFGDAVWGWS